MNLVNLIPNVKKANFEDDFIQIDTKKKEKEVGEKNI